LDHHADIEYGNTIIYAIENQKKLLADACRCQPVADLRSSYRIVYEVRAQNIFVLAIVHKRWELKVGDITPEPPK